MKISNVFLPWLSEIGTAIAVCTVLLVLYETPVLNANESASVPNLPEDNVEYFELGLCHTSNFQIDFFGTDAPPALSRLMESFNKQHSLTHEEPYWATVVHTPSEKVVLDYKQRGFFSRRGFDQTNFWGHVWAYFFGIVMYVPGEMRENTHIIPHPDYEGLRQRYCYPVVGYSAEAAEQAEEAIKAGEGSIFDTEAAHIRFEHFGWGQRDYHLFLQNCQHWTYWVLRGRDKSGPWGENMWGFGALIPILYLWPIITSKMIIVVAGLTIIFTL